MKKKIIASILSLVMVLSLAGCGSDSGSQTDAENVETTNEAAQNASGEYAGVSAKVALITMDQMDVHWVRLKAAAEEKVAEYNAAGASIELQWLAPETKDNAQQIQMIETAISNAVDYIVIACNDATSCNNALQEAVDAGIQVIYVDSPADFEGVVTYATDNYAGGKQAGEYLLEVLTEAGLTEGTIGIVDAQAGVQSCQDRYDGFAEVFENTDFTLGERQYSDGDNSKAQELANTLIANGVIAIYGTNDGATNGAAAAVADAANNGITVYCVGWDNSESNIAHIDSGELLAFMAQSPGVMGESAIDAVVQLEQGADLGGEVVDTGVVTVTLDNVADFK